MGIQFLNFKFNFSCGQSNVRGSNIDQSVFYGKDFKGDQSVFYGKAFRGDQSVFYKSWPMRVLRVLPAL